MTILLLETLHPDAEELLASVGRVRLAGDETAREAVLLEGEVTAILTRGRGRVTRELIERCPALKAVARCGVGVDNIDVAAATARGIPVFYTPGSTTLAVAEHTMMLMLTASRRLCTLDAAVRDGNWAIRNGWSSMELAGKRLGIVGLGEIGRRVAELAEAFGMEVCYWSRSSRDEQYTSLPLEELLASADVVSLHVALNDETRGLIGAGELARMKPSALLVNTARGAVVDQVALVSALEEGRPAFYATDVLAQQPPVIAEPLLRSPRLLVTPHVAALTDATFRAICVRSARNVVALLKGEEPEAGAIYNLTALEAK